MPNFGEDPRKSLTENRCTQYRLQLQLSLDFEADRWSLTSPITGSDVTYFSAKGGSVQFDALLSKWDLSNRYSCDDNGPSIAGPL